ncbi:MAG: accessory factor UbiK family protein [Parasphingorhabdus sp.]
MQSQNRFFDDISKVLNGLAGTVAGVGREAESSARERAKEWFGGMDFVSRDEFEAVKEMAAKARAEADALKKRLDALEKGAAAPVKKPAAKRAATAKPSATKPEAAKATARKPAAPKTGG